MRFFDGTDSDSNIPDIQEWRRDISTPPAKDGALEKPVEWPKSPSSAESVSSPAASIPEDEYYVAIETPTQKYLETIKMPMRGMITEILEYFGKIAVPQPSLENIQIMATQKKTLETLYELKELHKICAPALWANFSDEQAALYVQEHEHRQKTVVLEYYFRNAKLCDAAVITKTRQRLEACNCKHVNPSRRLTRPITF